MRIVQFRGPFGESVTATEFEVRHVGDFSQVATAYGQRMRVSIRLDTAPDDSLPVFMEMVEKLTSLDGVRCGRSRTRYFC